MSRPASPDPTLFGKTRARPVALSARGIVLGHGLDHVSEEPQDAVDLDIGRGEIVALLGRRGSGKSRLIARLAGMAPGASGAVRIVTSSGQAIAVPPCDPSAARRAGIGVAAQWPELPPDLDALAWVSLGEAPLWRPWHRRRALRAAMVALIRETGLSVPLDSPLGRLTEDMRHRVAILGALHRARHVLLLDEADAALTPQAADLLFGTLTRLAEGGLSVLFAARTAREAAFADRVVVLRDGRKVFDGPAADVDGAALAALIDAAPAPGRQPAGRGAAVLRLDGVTAPGQGCGMGLRDATLALNGGEILGVAGLPGHGQTALMSVIAGLRAPTAGTIRIGEALLSAGPAAAIAAGIAHLPAGAGLAAGLDLAEALALDGVATGAVGPGALFRRKRMRQQAADLADRAGLPGLDPDRACGAVGASRRLALAALLARTPRVVVAERPFDGLDDADAAAMAAALLAARARGAGVLLATTDPDELLALADRVAVLHRGAIGDPLPAGVLDRRALGLMMAGVPA